MCDNRHDHESADRGSTETGETAVCAACGYGERTENGRLIFDVSPFLIKINHKNEIMPKNEI